MYPINSLQFLIAASLFTILGFIVTYSKTLYRTTGRYELVITGFSGMLLLNAFFPHTLSAIYYKGYTPGLFSVIVIIMPLTTYILWKIYQSKEIPVRLMVTAIALGGVAGLVLMFMFLGIGYFISAV